MTTDVLRGSASPDAAEATEAAALGIRLGVARAFGSGAHETTSSCLSMLHNYPPARDSDVLDWGAGTGILSLAALRLGAGRALALDIEADSARACRSNAALNGLSRRLKAVQGSIGCLRETGAFGLVMANIHGDLILAEGRALAAHLAPGGTLVVSGLRFDEDYPARRLFEGLGLISLRRLFLTEYVTQVWRKKG